MRRKGKHPGQGIVPRRKRYAKGPDAFARAFERFIVRHGISKHFRLAALKTAWTEIVGESIAAMAYPTGMRNDILILGVEDSMLMQELSFISAELLDRVNDFLGERAVVDLSFEIDTSGRKTASGSGHAFIRNYERPALAGDAAIGEDSPLFRAYRAYRDFNGIQSC